MRRKQTISVIHSWIRDYLSAPERVGEMATRLSVGEDFLLSFFLNHDDSAVQQKADVFFQEHDFSLLSLASFSDLKRLFQLLEPEMIQYDSIAVIQQLKPRMFAQSLSSFQTAKDQLNALWYLRNLVKYVYNKDSFLKTKMILNQYPPIPSSYETLTVYQFLGSYNPYHMAHRAMVQQVLQNARSPLAHGCIAVMALNKSKPEIEENYLNRFSDTYIKLYNSNLIDPKHATLIDLPSGRGKSTDTLFHAHLISLVCHNPQVRIVIGSDKFIADIKRSLDLEKGQHEIGLKKFSLPHFRFFILVRKGDVVKEVRNLALMANQKYASKFKVLKQQTYEGESISSSKIKLYAASPDYTINQRARFMENGDITHEL